MEITALLIFATALLINSGSPGPSVAALVARVLTDGFRDVLPFLAAMWIGEAIWLTLAVWGLASLAASFETVFIALKWLGVLYLLFLAWKMWFAPVAHTPSQLPKRKNGLKMFLAGFVVTMGNPKIMVFYLALLPTIIDLANLTLIGWVAVTSTMLLVLITVDLAWALVATRARVMLKTPAAVSLTNRCGATMMALAATVIASR